MLAALTPHNVRTAEQLARLTGLSVQMCQYRLNVTGIQKQLNRLAAEGA